MPKETHEGLRERLKELAGRASKARAIEKALKDCDERLRAQFESMPVPTYIWQRKNEDFVLIDYNSAGAVITCGKIEDLLGKHLSELYQDRPEVLDDFKQCFEKKEIRKRESDFRLRATGEEKTFSVTYAFVPPDLVLVHTEDITARKHAEEELQRSYGRLEVLVEQRTAELSKANRNLETEIVQRRRAEEECHEQRKAYFALFEASPISLWVEDCSHMKACVQGLRAKGIENLREYFIAHPEEVLRCTQSVKIMDVNMAGLELFEASSKEELEQSAARIFREALDFKREKLVAIAEEKTVFEIDTEAHTLKGNPKCIHLKCTAAPGYENTLEKVFVSIMDITDRKRAEEECRKTGESYRVLFEDSPVCLCVEDCSHMKTCIEGLRIRGISDFSSHFGTYPEDVIHCSEPMKVRDVNRAGLELFKASGKEELIGGIDRVFGEESFAFKRNKLVAISQGKYIFEAETPVRTLDGNLKYIYLVCTAAPGSEVSLERVFVSIQDMTDRKRAEDALRESEESYRALAENLPGLVYRVYCRERKRMQFFNDMLEPMTGYTAQELAVGEICRIEPMIIPEDRPGIVAEVTDAIKHHRPFQVEYRLRHKNGSIRYFVERGRPTGGPDGNLLYIDGVMFDVTDRRQAEQALTESEHKFRTIVETAQEGIWVLDADHNTSYVNRRLTEMFGYSPEEMLGRHLHDFMDKEGRIQAQIYEERRKAGISEVHEFRFVRRDASCLWTLISTNPFFDSEGRYAGALGMLTDVTDRKRSEEALRESEAKYAALVEQARDGVFMVADERIKFANLALARMSGYEPDELIDMPMLNLIAPECRDQIAEIYGRRIKGEEPPTAFESRGLCKDGTVVDIEISTATIRYKGKPAGMGIVRDLTERKKTEAELLRIQKLEAIGILAGGIAHDFNNLLVSILGNITLVKLNPNLPPDLAQMIEEAERSSLRAKDLTSQLLTFARGGAPIRKLVTLSMLLEKAARSAAEGNNVRFEMSVPQDLWPIKADEGLIFQAIRSIVTNAQQAMPQGGTIEVRAENETVVRETALPLEPGNYVKISVCDTGIGIPKEFLSKVFDPYFTTKQKGSGLGLTIAYAVVKSHDGHIYVESELGVGTTVYVYLPAAREKRAEERTPERAEPEPIPEESRGRILLMDHEPMVRKVCGQMLIHLGFEVEYADDGAQAVGVYKEANQSGKPFDAVILDLTVPAERNGREAIKELAAFDPGIKAIVSSGSPDDPFVLHFREYGFSGAIAKPYQLTELEKVLEDVLGRG